MHRMPEGSTRASTRVAIYPGSFDPLTNGHVDIITRGARLFDRILVAILRNVQKTPLFSVEERITALRDALSDIGNVDVDAFDGLLVDYARLKGAQTIVRGLRAASDFEYETQMALMNRHLQPDVDTIFMMPDERYTYVSSRLVKDVFEHGGDVKGLVPPAVEQLMKQKRQAKSRG
jgi:pantetheine-phosphate adenylyltransferase